MHPARWQGSFSESECHRYATVPGPAELTGTIPQSDFVHDCNHFRGIIDSCRCHGRIRENYFNAFIFRTSAVLPSMIKISLSLITKLAGGTRMKFSGTNSFMAMT